MIKRQGFSVPNKAVLTYLKGEKYFQKRKKNRKKEKESPMICRSGIKCKAVLAI